MRAGAVQGRIVWALLMREIQLRWGRRNLGFAWLFCEPLIFAFPVLMMWSYMGRSEAGLPLIPFLWSGYLPLLLFRHIGGHCLNVVRQGASLLFHKVVTPLDIVIAQFGLEIIGNWTAMALSFLVFYILGVIEWPYDPGLFLLGNFYMAWWSVSVGLIVAACSERSEIVPHIWQPMSYMYMPVSGFFYLADWLPTQLREVALTLMPPLHCYEMIRGGLFGNRIQVFYDLSYVSFVLAVLTLLGLWLLRDVRRYIDFD
jgi:capsular polysaccharide transport system permease protein